LGLKGEGGAAGPAGAAHGGGGKGEGGAAGPAGWAGRKGGGKREEKGFFLFLKIYFL
jgi:hypothetical protein